MINKVHGTDKAGLFSLTLHRVEIFDDHPEKECLSEGTLALRDTLVAQPYSFVLWINLSNVGILDGLED
jgi:hypothetical protein